jgi:CRISPR-associated endonuclease/helicase Cas3
MSVATPVKSGFLAASLRVLTADLVLDEIDQYGAEDLAAIARLVFQVAAGGRRAIIMSATIPRDVAETLYTAYSAGWKEYARMKGAPNHVNILCTGDAPGSCVTNVEGMAFSDIYTQCSARVLSALAAVDPLRRGEFLPPVEDWKTLVDQIDLACSRMHDLNKTEMDGFQVSIGLVRMTRISHTAALAVQIPSGNIRRRLRLKLCLHSNFPRLHRAWIENRLKRALSRKGPDSDRGLRSFCHELEVFRRASAIDVRDIEIVCVTSPVIETGNDLDFDYAIIDPVSLRSVVQSAGRVRRHRYGLWRETNILMLDRSPIVMQGGRLAMPGVETAPNSATRVSKVLLDKFPDRRFPELIGRVRFDSVTAAAILSEAEACPLREAEQKLREKMLCCEGSSPVGIYIGQVAARMNREFTKSRRFRRSTTRSVLYTKVGGSLTSAEWRVNLVPHERGSRFVGLNRDQIHEINYPEDGILVPTITERAWLNFSGGRHEMSESDIRRFFEVNIPMYADFEDHVIPTITYSEFTGLTRGPSDNLFKPFGS